MADKAFPTLEVLSVFTGRLLCEMGGCYRVLNYMSGDDLMTHQLPRVAKEVQPVLLKKHPHLAATLEEAEQITRENWKEFADRWVARYGQTIDVPQMSVDEHESIDPISEAAEMFHPKDIGIVVTE